MKIALYTKNKIKIKFQPKIKLKAHGASGLSPRGVTQMPMEIGFLATLGRFPNKNKSKSNVI